MQISISLLENQKLEAHFDGYSIACDQPVSNKGDGSAPGPFDYFLASTALCAGYYVKAYCSSRNISTDGIKIIQNNTKDPENKYKYTFDIKVEVPVEFSQKDRDGILRSIQGCTVKKAIQQMPDFNVEVFSLNANN
ncbi:MAG: OsmC family protein [Bacteriovorax sp.]|nr:OsmC family protein [Bacteriovorax sp.]